MSHARPTRKHSIVGADATIGYFINLDRSRDRRRRVESELAKVGLAKKYKRITAVDGQALRPNGYAITPSEAGCFLSHLGALKAGRKANRHFHVLEDDARLNRNFARHLNAIMGSVIADFDIVFTEMWLPIDQAEALLSMYRDYLATGALAVIPNNYAAGMTSYVVNINAADKLISLLEDEVRSGMKAPVDVCVGNLVASGALQVGCLFPFITTTWQETVMPSTIARPREPAAKRLMEEAPRSAFYVDADLKALRLNIAGIHLTDVSLLITQRSAISLIDAVLDMQMRDRI